MAKAGYTIVTGGAVSLSAATAKTILGVKSNAAFGLDLKRYRISFAGTSASAVPVLVEICHSTMAVNQPGTNSTTVTPLQSYGRVMTHGVTAAKNWTAEPTALNVLDELLLTPYGGLILYDWPLGDSPDCGLGEGFAIRCTAPAAVDVRASMLFERA